MSRQPNRVRRALVVVPTACAMIAPAVAGAAVPIPTVTGPLPSSAASHPFGAAAYQMVPEDLSKSGYVEEEFLVSGLANVYKWDAAGPAEVKTANAPYTTRILVRRPQNPARSSGNAVVEMFNPSNLMDLNIGWSIMREHFMRKGDTWIGITIRPNAVDALKQFDSARYAPVSFADPVPPAERKCQAGGVEVNQERGLAWDMNSQVGAWIRSGAATNPLRGVISRVYGFGYSQTGGYLNTYTNAIHKLATLDNGAPVYDGYFIAVAGGGFVGLSPINNCDAAPPVGDPRRETGNLGVPIIRAMSLSDFVSGIAGRRADSDTPQDPYRHYEIAGMGHASPFELYYSAQPADMVKAGRTPPPMNCNEGPRSRFPTNIAFDAILENLDRWSRTGIAPPRAELIQRVDNTTVVDEHGNVVGGVRSPYVDVPTSTWFGAATGASFCFIAGYERPFSAEKLAQLYPSKADYVAKVEASTRALVQQRFITEADGRYIMQEARYACVPGPANDPFAPRCWNDAEGGVGGTVPATLSLTLGAPASFGAFTPGVAREYTASTTASVVSSAGDATLTVSDPSSVATGRLVNGAFSLAQPLQGLGVAKTWAAPVSNEQVTVTFKQAIGANEALRTGSYSKTLTFTLSTTTP
jgi:hypothetical protein